MFVCVREVLKEILAGSEEQAAANPITHTTNDDLEGGGRGRGLSLKGTGGRFFLRLWLGVQR